MTDYTPESLDAAARELSGFTAEYWATFDAERREGYEDGVRKIVALLAPAPSMTLTMPRTVTTSEVDDLVYGTGALGMPWWIDAPTSPVGSIVIEHWHRDAQGDDDGERVRTALTYPQIVAAASRYLALTTDTSLDLSDSLGDADSLHADSILQIAVYGSIIFG